MSYAIACINHDPYPGAAKDREAGVVLWYRRPRYSGDVDLWVPEPKGGLDVMIPGRDLTLWHNIASAKYEMPKVDWLNESEDSKPRSLRGKGYVTLGAPCIVKVPLIHPPIHLPAHR